MIIFCVLAGGGGYLAPAIINSKETTIWGNYVPMVGRYVDNQVER